MARPLIAFLLLLNGLMLLAALGMDRLMPVPVPGQTPQEPERVAQQLRAESIRIVSRAQPASATQAPSSASAAWQPASAASAAAVAASAATPAATPAATAPVTPASAAR